MATLAKAETAANLPVFLMNSRRDAETCMDDFMAVQSPYTYMWLPFRGHAKSIEDAVRHSSASSPSSRIISFPRNSGRATEQVSLGGDSASMVRSATGRTCEESVKILRK